MRAAADRGEAVRGHRGAADGWQDYTYQRGDGCAFVPGAEQEREWQADYDRMKDDAGAAWISQIIDQCRFQDRFNRKADWMTATGMPPDWRDGRSKLARCRTPTS